MQPITVYGIETLERHTLRRPSHNACSLLPFTVLKRREHTLNIRVDTECMQPIREST